MFNGMELIILSLKRIKSCSNYGKTRLGKKVYESGLDIGKSKGTP